MTVRREKVVLDLDGNFTSEAVRAAAAAKILDHEIGALGRQSVVTSGQVTRTETSTRQASSEIDRMSGRVKLLATTLGAIGPAAVPIAGAAVPAVAGLSTELGFAALAAGSAVIAFQGVGDALKALSDARINPTAANLMKARQAMEGLSPAGQDLVRTLSGLSDEWERTKAIAQGGLFPGAEQAVDSLMTRLPELQRILAIVSTTAGDLLAEGADSLASSRWDDLFNYLENSAKPIMVETAHTAGSLTHALAQLVIALDPLSKGFAADLSDAADQLDRWASSLQGSQGLEDFISYIQTTGPEVADTIGSIASSVVSLLQATSGAGSASLAVLKGIADSISLIADSPVGPPLIQLVSLMSMLALAQRAWDTVATGSIARYIAGNRAAIGVIGETITAQQRAMMSTQELAAAQATLNSQQRAAFGTLGRTAAGIAGLGLAAYGTQHHLAGMNSVSMALMGSMLGPWGTAIGFGSGLLVDIAQKQQEAAQATSEFTQTLDQQTGALTDNSRAWVVNQIGDDWLTYADKAGISVTEVTDAILQGGDALDQLQAKVRDAAGSSWNPFNSDAWTNDASEFNKLLDSTRGKLEEGDRQFARHKEVVGETAGAYSNAAAQVERFTTAVQRLNGWLDKRAAWRAYEQSVDDARKALKKNGETLDINTQKGRTNAASIDAIIRNTGELASQLKGSDRQAFLTQARHDIRDMLQQAGASQDAIKRIMDRLRALDGQTANTYVVTHYKQTHETGMGPQPTLADGGTIPKTGLPYADRHPILAADGEEVISNRYGQADRHRSLLKAINANRFADGGTIARAWERVASRVQSSAGFGPPVVNVNSEYGGLEQRLDLVAVRVGAVEASLRNAPERTGRAVLGALDEGSAREMRVATW